ncbi:MAG: ABC transporter substrate-binding protein [Desulforhopalus sp.]|nr:ABC transporter substrate-binding protein [Desulforhopalus sp.]
MKKIAVFLCCFFLALSFTTASFAKEWKTVRVAVEGAYPPFSYIQPDGSIEGFDIDIAHALGQAMGVEIVLVQQNWDGMIPGLLARKYDAIIASMSITEERRKKVGFTDKYYQTPVKFIAKKGAYTNFTEAVLKGKTIGVQRETIHDKYLTAQYGKDVKIKRYGNLDEAYLDITAGRLDLIIADSAALYTGFLTKENGSDYEFVGPDMMDEKWFGEGVGIEVRKQNTKLAEMFNKAIQTIRANGEYKKIQDKYFNFDVYGK